MDHTTLTNIVNAALVWYEAQKSTRAAQVDAENSLRTVIESYRRHRSPEQPRLQA
jgi:hypothetical protein